jgi:hypothetical protein
VENLPRVCMKIVEIDVDSFIDEYSHECESFWSETVGLGGIGAGGPFHAGEIHPGEVGERVQA